MDSVQVVESDGLRESEFQHRVRDSDQFHPEDDVAVCLLQRIGNGVTGGFAAHDERRVITGSALQQAVALPTCPQAGCGGREVAGEDPCLDAVAFEILPNPAEMSFVVDTPWGMPDSTKF